MVQDKDYKYQDKDYIYMERALQLAKLGAGHVSPNPMVGAVIVSADDRIIGEGYHRRFGEGHAEVNAFASVRPADEHLLAESTIYVTLEPCSHYGKTPPCAKLLVDKGIKRAVIGITDPNPKVSGRGISILREAGIEVRTGVLAEECQRINCRFLTAQTRHRPWIELKWAESADGFIGNLPGNPRLIISTPASAVAVHRERSMVDAIMVGTGTLLADNPRLDNRLWPGNSPRPVIFASPRIDQDALRLDNPIVLDPDLPLAVNMESLFADYGVTSLLVEGGAKLLQSFIDADLYDRIRIETSNTPAHRGVASPILKKRRK